MSTVQDVAEGMPEQRKPQSAPNEEVLPLIRVIDILLESRGFCRCAWQAASALDDHDAGDGLMTVLNMIEVDTNKAIDDLRTVVDRMKLKGDEQ